MNSVARVALLAVAALWILAPCAIAQEPEEAPKLEMALQPPTFDANKRVISVSAATNLPEKAVLTCTISLGASTGPRCQALVGAGGKVQFSFPPVPKKAVLIPGTYKFEVSCNPQDQVGPVREALLAQGVTTAFVEAEIGESPDTPATGEKVDKIHQDLVELLKQLRALYMTTESTASFTVARIFTARNKAGGNISEQEGERIMTGWREYAERHFEENYRLLNLNFKDYKESAYITPFPDAEKEIETLLTLVRKWYSVSWVELGEMAGIELPQELKEDANFPKRILLPQINEASKRAYLALKAEPEDWVQVTAFRPEEGIVDGLKYMSKTSKFTISLPDDQWEFNKDMVHPQVRLRLTHKNDSMKDWGVVAVELRDYPECEAPKDLDVAVEIDASERWPGYKKIRGGPVRVDDDAMEDGKRPGFDLSFLAVAPDKKRFHIVDYALYCRWYKRTYSVIMIADEEHFEEFEKAFEKIKKSFRVLDKQ